MLLMLVYFVLHLPHHSRVMMCWQTILMELSIKEVNSLTSISLVDTTPKHHLVRSNLVRIEASVGMSSVPGPSPCSSIRPLAPFTAALS